MTGGNGPAQATALNRWRAAIPFRSINRRGQPGYDAGLQRHHLLPRQLLRRDCFGKLFAELGRGMIGFDDFRVNGLLLPANEDATLRTGMPLHRGPHRRYNEMVIERVGRIEHSWSSRRTTDPQAAAADAQMRFQLLQSALRRHLLSEKRKMLLNRKDPLGQGFDFAELDSMAEQLWQAT